MPGRQAPGSRTRHGQMLGHTPEERETRQRPLNLHSGAALTAHTAERRAHSEAAMRGWRRGDSSSPPLRTPLGLRGKQRGVRKGLRPRTQAQHTGSSRRSRRQRPAASHPLPLAASRCTRHCAPRPECRASAAFSGRVLSEGASTELSGEALAPSQPLSATFAVPGGKHCNARVAYVDRSAAAAAAATAQRLHLFPSVLSSPLLSFLKPRGTTLSAAAGRVGAP